MVWSKLTSCMMLMDWWHMDHYNWIIWWTWEDIGLKSLGTGRLWQRLLLFGVPVRCLWQVTGDLPRYRWLTSLSADIRSKSQFWTSRMAWTARKMRGIGVWYLESWQHRSSILKLLLRWHHHQTIRSYQVQKNPYMEVSWNRGTPKSSI